MVLYYQPHKVSGSWRKWAGEAVQVVGGGGGWAEKCGEMYMCPHKLRINFSALHPRFSAHLYCIPLLVDHDT